MPFKKGDPNINRKGRAEGTKNKFTTLKQAFISTFERIGGEDALYEYLNPDPIKVKSKKGRIRIIDETPSRQLEFFKMLSKMLPADVQVSGPEGTPLIPPTITFVAGVGTSQQAEKT
jgi:hypothetical protein